MIAITGSTGFIGSYIGARLGLPQKRLSRQKIVIDHHPHKWMKGDLGHPESLEEFIAGSPVLIHLACTSHPRSSNLDFSSDIQNNLITTIKLFESYAQQNPGGHIIFSSTGGNMYDPNDAKRIWKEHELPSPQSSYGINKLAAENYLRFICEKYRIGGTIFRISNPYGVILPTARTQGLIGIAIAKLIARESLQIFDSFESVRDYIHLDDVTSAFKLAVENPPARAECRLFNVSSGIGHSLAQVLEIIEKVTGLPLKKNISATNSLKSTYTILSSRKIQNVLGWLPRIDLKNGIQRMWHQTCNKS